MSRSAFPPSPFGPRFEEEGVHPAGPLLCFVLLSVAIGLAWSPDKLALAAAGVGFVLLLPRGGARPLRMLLLFAPLLLATPLFHLFPWRGFEGQWRPPWIYDAAAWPRGLTAAARMALWILLSARIVDRLHPAVFMARLPASGRGARLMLAPVLALSWLDLMIREAWLLERAFRARGGGGLKARALLLLPLFRNLASRAETLSEALILRRFPAHWAGRPAPRVHWSQFPPALIAAAVLVWILLMPRT